MAAVGLPGGEQVLNDGGLVADVDPVLVEVEPEGFRPSLPQSEGGRRFGRIAEPEEFGEPHRPVLALDVAEDAAGADGGELLVVADQADTATPTDDELDGGVERQRVAIPASSITTSVDEPIRDTHPGRSSLWMDQVSLARVSA